MVNKIETLNKKIDTLMKEKTKADAQKDVWKKRLFESIEDYKKEYGVDLSASSFAVIKEKLNAEIKGVEDQTMKEYEQAEKIVSMIQSGDIKGARKELGLDVEEVEEVPEVEQSELQGVSSAILDVEDDFGDDIFLGEDADEDGIFEDAELEDGDILVDESEEDEEESPKSVVSGISFDDEDDDDDFVIPPSKTDKKEGGMLVMDDDDEEENPFGGSFGGFGGILSGSKFDVGKNK